LATWWSFDQICWRMIFDFDMIGLCRFAVSSH